MDYSSVINQRILNKLVNKGIIMRATDIVEYILEKSYEDDTPFSWENAENGFRKVCPQCCGDLEKLDNSSDYKCLECEAISTEDVLEETSWIIYEWYFVTDWFANKLKKHGEIVIDNGLYNIWGRCNSGQSVILDYVIEKIGKDMKILEGMENDWSKTLDESSYDNE